MKKWVNKTNPFNNITKHRHTR